MEPQHLPLPSLRVPQLNNIPVVMLVQVVPSGMSAGNTLRPFPVEPQQCAAPFSSAHVWESLGLTSVNRACEIDCMARLVGCRARLWLAGLARVTRRRFDNCSFLGRASCSAHARGWLQVVSRLQPC